MYVSWEYVLSLAAGWTWGHVAIVSLASIGLLGLVIPATLSTLKKTPNASLKRPSAKCARFIYY